MALTHQPTKDWIVVRIEKETRDQIPLVRGIYQPNAPQIAPKKYGVVVAMGPGRENEIGIIPEPVCKVGDTVMLREVAGEPVVVDGEELLWSIPDEIMAIVVPA
jgi:co-chaperonin GroES (HSP10)